MDPYIPPVNPGTSTSSESESSDEAKRDERHHEKMQAFKQAIERTRLANDPTAAISQSTSLPQSKTPTTSTPRKPVGQGALTDFQLPEGAELPEEFAALKQESPPPPQLKPTPQAPLDPAYRQALLRMQAEGVQLPGSLLDLLEGCEGVKPQTGKDKTSVEASAEESAGFAEQDPSDPAAADRHAQAKAAAFADTDTHSGSGSPGKSKQSAIDSSDAGIASAALPLHTQPFTPQTQLAGEPQRIPPPPPLVQQLVEFATFGRNESGFLEFRLGLVEDALGGLRIQLASYGNRRVGLKVKGAGGRSAAIGDAEIAGLIDALKARNVEVVEVVRE